MTKSIRHLISTLTLTLSPLQWLLPVDIIPSHTQIFPEGVHLLTVWLTHLFSCTNLSLDLVTRLLLWIFSLCLILIGALKGQKLMNIKICMVGNSQIYSNCTYILIQCTAILHSAFMVDYVQLCFSPSADSPAPGSCTRSYWHSPMSNRQRSRHEHQRKRWGMWIRPYNRLWAC